MKKLDILSYSFSIPESYNEITYQQYLDITTIPSVENTDAKFISKLFNIDYKEFINTVSIDEFQIIIDALGQLNKSNIQYTPCDEISGIKIPKNVGKELPTGAVIDIDEETRSGRKQSIMILNIAVYGLLKSYCGSYDVNKFDELKALLLEAPCTQVLYVADFFLIKIADSYKHTTNASLRTNPIIKLINRWRRTVGLIK